MKIKLTCKECHESFNISTEYLKSKSTIICPNCSDEFPKNKFQNFKDSLLKLDEINESFNATNNCGFPVSSWKFEIL